MRGDQDAAEQQSDTDPSDLDRRVAVQALMARPVTVLPTLSTGSTTQSAGTVARLSTCQAFR